MPFGDQTLKDKSNYKYLTVEQVMMDYVELIRYIRENYQVGGKQAAVIVSGGSYGGMLAAWLKMKYPQTFQGALASSAPILFFAGMVSPYAYNQIATESFAQYDASCPDIIRKGFQVLDSYKLNKDKYSFIQETFNLCDAVTGPFEVEGIINAVSGALGTMAMVNYPYATSFIFPMPGNPVQHSCEQATNINPVNDEDYVVALNAAVQVYYNYTGTVTPCYNVSDPDQGGLDADGWSILACNEMAMPIGQNGVTDMFLPAPWNYQEYTKYC